MRALVQRVSEASVEVAGELVGRISSGLLVFYAAGRGDTAEDLDYLTRKIVNLRIFADEAGKMNRSLLDTGGEALVVSQFTLYADTRKGNRPSFTAAADPDEGRRWYDRFVDALVAQGIHVETGEFGAHMRVHLINDGPVTIWLDSAERKRSRRS
ncbi:MAG TPA: D-tyrosyl-tRNA(Tyr) deacylase [Oceanithermus profundus]|uniref:D-aminoacyl-tRNA deacylase n=1 Tax=Oceanithermus profundus TaxID=187137 RepID=A0A7C4ZSL2_9DEIN|nr:D-tyrosyl-tRNA(Tyr) deacylase [Oceanithermus profundus]